MLIELDRYQENDSPYKYTLTLLPHRETRSYTLKQRGILLKKVEKLFAENSDCGFTPQGQKVWQQILADDQYAKLLKQYAQGTLLVTVTIPGEASFEGIVKDFYRFDTTVYVVSGTSHRIVSAAYVTAREGEEDV